MFAFLQGFLFYHEKQASGHFYSDSLYDPATPRVVGLLLTLSPFTFRSSSSDYSRTILIKQTYTVFVDTTRGQQKWHLSE